jgi:hypothetical protein
MLSALYRSEGLFVLSWLGMTDIDVIRDRRERDTVGYLNDIY